VRRTDGGRTVLAVLCGLEADEDSGAGYETRRQRGCGIHDERPLLAILGPDDEGGAVCRDERAYERAVRDGCREHEARSNQSNEEHGTPPVDRSSCNDGAIERAGTSPATSADSPIAGTWSQRDMPQLRKRWLTLIGGVYKPVRSLKTLQCSRQRGVWRTRGDAG